MVKLKNFLIPLIHRLSYRQKFALERRIGYFFTNQNLKEQSLTHKSLANESGHERHNERLEFLGDAVFDLCISDLLMQEYPDADEGDLSKMRASLVNTDALADLALFLKLDQEMKMGMSESRDRGQLKPRLLACVLEALVGAVYLDGGYKKVKIFVMNLVEKKIKEGPVNKDYKSILQEFVQKKFQRIPTYNILDIKGVPHAKVFVMEAIVDQKVVGQGTGKSKKQATQMAAFSALKKLKAPPFHRILES